MRPRIRRRGAHAAGVPFSAARRKPRSTHLSPEQARQTGERGFGRADQTGTRAACAPRVFREGAENDTRGRVCSPFCPGDLAIKYNTAGLGAQCCQTRRAHGSHGLQKRMRAVRATGWHGLPARLRRQLAAESPGGLVARRNRPVAGCHPDYFAQPTLPALPLDHPVKPRLPPRPQQVGEPTRPALRVASDKRDPQGMDRVRPEHRGVAP